MPNLILATRNENKANEIIQIFNSLNIDTSKIEMSKYKEPTENGV